MTARHSDKVIRASDVMTPNPLSISATASIRQAAEFLRARRMSAAPIINEAGRAVGVVSLSDIARFAAGGDWESRQYKSVRNIMNDEVYFVRPHTSLPCVVEDLAHCKLKRLFVVDDDGVVVGVISATDALRALHAARTSAPEQSTARDVQRRIPVTMSSSALGSAPSAEVLMTAP